MARDTVTVPKSLERKLAYWLKGISSPEKNVSVYLEANERQAVIDALLFTARESLSPSSDPEGGARGVQGSSADGQHCNEQFGRGLSPAWRTIDTAPRDGTPFIGAFWSIRWADSHRKEDVVRCWYQPEFEAFISSCREMQVHNGYTFADGSTRQLHSPVIEPVTHWMPLPAPPAVADTCRDVPENDRLVSGVSSAPFSSTRKDERA